MSGRAGGERGVTVVEAAFALPLLFLFMFGLVDLGMWSFNANQATNAAKDGARAAIIDYRLADIVGSADHDRVVAAVEEHLDRDVPAGDVDVTCIQEDGAAVSGGCAFAVMDTDRVRVAVDWTWELVTPVAGVVGVSSGEAKGVATMTIVGAPVSTAPTVPTTDPPPSTAPTSAPPPVVDCVVSDLKIGSNRDSSSAIRTKTNMQLRDAVWVSFDTNGADRCEGLAVHLTTPDGTVRSVVCDNCQVGHDHDWQYTSLEKIWPTGTATARIFNTYIDVSTTFTVTT